MRNAFTSRCAAAAMMLCAVLASTRATHGASVTATLNPDDPASPADWVLIRFDGVDFPSTFAGRLNWLNLSGPNAFPSPFHTFCIEFDRDLDLDTHLLTTGDLGDRLDMEGAGLGDLKADRLSELWADRYDQLTTSSAGAAFQLAVWEIVYDTGLAGNLLLDNGRFEVNYDGNSIPAYVSLAHEWLGALDGMGPKAAISALLSDTTQDQIILAPVPLPGTAAAGIMLLGSISLRRQRRAT